MKTPLASAIAAAAIFAACGRNPSAPAHQPVTIVQPASSQEKLANVEVARIAVTPATLQQGQSVTVRADFKNAPDRMLATFAWFGPDGWLVVDDTRDVTGNTATFILRGEAFKEPGHYYGELRSGTVHLGEATLEVAG